MSAQQNNKRIVSLVPSLTQTICEAGLKSQVVGITSFCIDPPDLHRTATVIGGTKDPDIDLIRKLQPTHIIANEEENKLVHLKDCAQIAPLLTTFPKSPVDVPSMLSDMAKFFGDDAATVHMTAWSQQIVEDLNDLRRAASNEEGRDHSFLYLIWRNPWMASGSDTYISHSLTLAGFHNVLKDGLHGRYPSLSIEQIASLNPAKIFFSSEPYPFRKRDLDAMHEEIPNIVHSKLYWIDGKLLSWYGFETLKLLSFLKEKWPPVSGGHLKSWTVDLKSEI